MREIPLTRGQVALVDDEDYEALSKFKWRAERAMSRRENWYAVRTINLPYPHKECMHRIILDAPSNRQVDHINGNGLDNRRRNLRLATPTQNRANSDSFNVTGFRGVTVRKERSRHPYRAKIRINGAVTHLGTFPTPEEAARAYDAAARVHYGEFARLNFPNDNTPPSTDVVRDAPVAVGAGA